MSILPKRILLTGLILWMGIICLAPALQGAPLPNRFDDLRKKAREYLDRGQWADAFEIYLRIPKNDRSQADKDAYHSCLRHLLQYRRLRDKPSQTTLGPFQPAQVLNVYKEVLEKLQAHYLDREKVNLTQLYLNGVQEMRFALEDEAFLKEHLGHSRPESLQGFKSRLDGQLDNPPAIRTVKEARDQLHLLSLASEELGLKPAALILEFICGACNTLDEYTLYLSAQQLLGLELELSGKYVGIGIDVGVSEQKLFIIRVLRGSPAEQALLAPGDRILRIDGQSVDPLASAAAAARLLGEEGTSVELEVQPLGHPGSLPPPLRTIKLIRQAVYLSSVETFFEFKEEAKDHSGIGYIKLASFQKNTLHELKDALLQLQSQSLGLKVLVLDLRGNLGGYFPAARQVAELFLQEGVIVYTQTRHREEAHRANNPQALTLPLVLLVDGETASAAEVVAGAFKETGRATLVGQPTFGKGTIQCLVRLDTIKSGLQITIARFCSPNHISYDGRGVLPDRYVERTGMMGDGQREAAFQVADQMLKLVPR